MLSHQDDDPVQPEPAQGGREDLVQNRGLERIEKDVVEQRSSSLPRGRAGTNSGVLLPACRRKEIHPLLVLFSPPTELGGSREQIRSEAGDNHRSWSTVVVVASFDSDSGLYSSQYWVRLGYKFLSNERK